jgi:hypothetical protein
MTDVKTMTLYEAEMKAMLLNHLFAKGIVSNGDTILNEFTFNKFERRIDLAVLTRNQLLGIEIKSEVDSLSRLEGQLLEYQNYFDKVIVFVADKHVKNSLKIINGNEELIAYCGGKFLCKKRGKITKTKNKLHYIRMMRANELAKLCNLFGQGASALPRKKLEIEAEKISIKHLREWSFHFLKKRYSENTQNFWKNAYDSIDENHLSLLNRNRRLNKKGSPDSIAQSILKGKKETISLDIDIPCFSY